MPTQEQSNTARKHAQAWLQAPLDVATRTAVEKLLPADKENELVEAFYQPLVFGTGGLRAKMGIGCSRMNKYTVAIITQGLANYLLATTARNMLRAVVAYDSRLQSATFAQVVADVLSANGTEVHLFTALRPTPLLAFAIRQLGASCGVMLTASHNPKTYNGYKIYGNDGAQLTTPVDTHVMDAISAVQDIASIRFTPQAPIHKIAEEIDGIYLQKTIDTLNGYGLQTNRRKQLKIVYSSLHGTGITLLPALMEGIGYDKTTFQTVPEQSVPDGHFSTVELPNPEEETALAMAIAQAKEVGAHLVMATDPDADRIGIAVRHPQGQFVCLNGNQTAVLMLDFILRWHSNRNPVQPPYVVKTIVTSGLFQEIAQAHDIPCYDTLTGFKYIAAEIAKRAAKETFLFGAEESYGYLLGDHVRDKDAISAAGVIALMAEEAANAGHTLLDRLCAIYLRFGLYEEALHASVKEGLQGITDIQQMMHNWQTNPPAALDGQPVAHMIDYTKSYAVDLRTQVRHAIKLPKSPVLQFITADGSKVSLRPSGTEPKLKAYISVRTSLNKAAELPKKRLQLQEKIRRICTSLGL